VFNKVVLVISSAVDGFLYVCRLAPLTITTNGKTNHERPVLSAQQEGGIRGGYTKSNHRTIKLDWDQKRRGLEM
jgi:hypothetical protein